MSIFSVISRAAAAATIVFLAGGPGLAESASGLATAPAQLVKVSAAGKGSAKFDWLRPVQSAPVLQVAAATPLGNGSWICSPSGFGSKSKCYHR